MQGTWDPGFTTAVDAFAELFHTHPGGGLPEAGAAFAVMVDGRLVLDCWDGTADAARRLPWEHDTVVCFFSCTKGVVALAANQLIDAGLVDPEAPVARYWPEFAAAGKEQVTVAQLLSHQAGLPRLRAPLAPGGIWQWDTVVEAFAAEEPHWQPGTAHGYHTLSFGHLVGELVRRVTGEPIARVVQNRIAGPLGVDLNVGAPAPLAARVAHLHDPPPTTTLGPVSAAAHAVDPAMIAAYDDPHLLTPAIVNSAPWRAAAVPGANGHGNARALATMWGTLAVGGTAGGIRLLSAAAIDAATETRAAGVDRTIGMHVSYGLGWMLSEGDRCFRPGSRSFWHGGAYGSLGHADPDARLGIGYVFNQCGEPQLDGRAQRLVDAVYDCL